MCVWQHQAESRDQICIICQPFSPHQNPSDLGFGDILGVSDKEDRDFFIPCNDHKNIGAKG